jgi:uncharacterized protein (DUF983 family)
MATRLVSLRCPRCGRGDLVDIAFDAGASRGTEVGKETQTQDADTRQLESYSCGHRLLGPRLSTADADRLDVERRSSEDTVQP